MTEADPIVFVVDDDPSIRDALTSLLRSVGLRVETFGSAQEFLTRQPPDAPGTQERAELAALRQCYDALTPRERDVMQARRLRLAQQADRCRIGYQRNHHQDAPRSGHAQDARRVLRGARPDGRNTGSTQPPGISPPIPRYNSLPATHTVSFPKKSNSPDAHTRPGSSPLHAIWLSGKEAWCRDP